MIKRICLSFFKKKFIKNYCKCCEKKIGQALLYYKTSPFLFEKFNFVDCSHTNNWEVLEIAKILNKLGFWVDIIDRSIKSKEIKVIEDKYDIFIGIGAGNSGRHYPEIAKRVKRAIKILYATSQEPNVFNKALKKRYEYFFRRHPGAKLPYIGFKTQVNMLQVIQNTDFIFCTGNKYTIKTYHKHGKPIYKIFVSTFPKINFSLKELYNRSQNKFLYFGGNRNILKGLDLLIESFAELPDLELYICTPAKEKEFNLFYKSTLSRSRNIHWMGFVLVGEKTFNWLTSQCGYVILPSCTEGTATSVVTCMRKGLIPIVTHNTGIDLGDFGYLIEDISIETLKSQLRKISRTPRKEFIRRSIKSYFASFNYTQAKFSESFEKALIDALLKRKLIFLYEKK